MKAKDRTRDHIENPKSKKKKSPLLAVAVVAAAGLLLYAALQQGRPPEKSAQPNTQTAEATAEVAEEPEAASGFEGYRPKDQLETLLVFGVDKFEEDTHTDSYNNLQQADFLMLMIFDDALEETRAITINRDAMAEVMVLGVRGERVRYKTMQIALAHTYGTGGKDSCNNTADAVSRLLGDIDIDHYICLTMDAVPIINDLCGGVTVKIEEDLTALDPKMTAGATYTLMGSKALEYVRARSSVSDGTNISRMGRQRQYMQALAEKLMAVPEDSDKELILRLTAELSDYMVSDCTVTQLDRLYDKGQAYTSKGFFDIPGESVLGEKYMEFTPDEQALDMLIRDVFFEKD